MSTPGSNLRRGKATYRKGFEDGVKASFSQARFNVAHDDENGHTYIVCVDWLTREAAESVAREYRERYVGQPFPNGKGHYKISNVRIVAEFRSVDWRSFFEQSQQAAASTAKVETTAPASLFPSSGGEATLAPTDQTSFHDSAKTSVSGHDPQALNDDQVDAVLQLIERRLCIIWSQVGAREAFANELRLLEPPAAEDQELCVACDIPFEDGDMVYWCSDDTGHIHADCCGPERESYVNPDGSPLKDDEPIPQPFAWRA